MKRNMQQKETNARTVSFTTTKSKMELFVRKVNGSQPLIFVTKSSILDFAVVPDPPLNGHCNF